MSGSASVELPLFGWSRMDDLEEGDLSYSYARILLIIPKLL